MTSGNEQAPPTGKLPLVLVTGVSGAGKSSALKALEDMGFEAVDNLPLSLMGRLVAPAAMPKPDAVIRWPSTGPWPTASARNAPFWPPCANRPTW